MYQHESPESIFINNISIRSMRKKISKEERWKSRIPRMQLHFPTGLLRHLDLIEKNHGWFFWNSEIWSFSFESQKWKSKTARKWYLWDFTKSKLRILNLQVENSQPFSIVSLFIGWDLDFVKNNHPCFSHSFFSSMRWAVIFKNQFPVLSWIISFSHMYYPD